MPTRTPTPRPSARSRLAQAASGALLVVVLALAAALAALGILNRRSVERAAERAYDGRALDVGLSTAAALWMLHPRERDQLATALQNLTDGPIESLAVVSAKGRVLASSDRSEAGRRLDPDPALARLLRGEAVHRLRRLSDGQRPRYEIWIVLRPGIRRFGRWGRWRDRARGPGPGRGRGPGSGQGRGRGWAPGRGFGPDGMGRPWRGEMRRRRGGGMGRVPWGRAFLRVRLQVSDPPIAEAVSRAQGVQLASLVGSGLLLVLGLLAFLADSRHRRLQRRMAQQRRLAEMGEMAAVLAHEIRNPLGVIKGYAQLLHEKAEPQGRQTLAQVVSETGRLERLVNALLDYARPAEPQLGDVDLTALVEQACELSAEEVVRAQVRLVRDLEPCRVRVDADQLLQVTLNLLRNAIQATPPGGAITVRLVERGGLTRLEVADSGPGLPAELGEDIFKPFVTTRADGTGLGLAISRQIAEAHGGSLTATSRRDAGARFMLTLPAKE